MRKILLSLLVAFALNSCTNDESKEIEITKAVFFEDELLIGYWVNDADSGNTIRFTYDAIQGKTYLQFELKYINTNGNFLKYNGLWKFEQNNNLKLYDINFYNNSLTPTSNNYIYNNKIIDLSATKLKWEEPGVQFGTIITRSFTKT